MLLVFRPSLVTGEELIVGLESGFAGGAKYISW